MTHPTLTLPEPKKVLGRKVGASLSDEQDIAYNAECTRLVREAIAKEGGPVRTHYPFDAEDGSTDDLVGLDDEGELVILETERTPRDD